MSVINIIEDKSFKGDKDQQINALSWCITANINKEELLAIGTAAGWVKIIDAKKNKIVTKLQIS